MKISKLSVQQLSIPEKEKYKIYRDDKLTGFCVRVTRNGVKTFIVDKKVDKKVRRITIGRFGQLTVEQARQQAQKILSQLCIGINPQEDKDKDNNLITLGSAFEDYLLARKSLHPSTIAEYRSVMAREFQDWQSKPLNEINSEMVAKRHAMIGSRSHYSANKAFKVIRAIFNFSMYNYDDPSGNPSIAQNPVVKISKTRAWFPKHRRRSKISNHELKIWFKAVSRLRNKNELSIANSAKHYLLTLLFTGLRREEAIRLIWSEYKSKDSKVAKTQRIVDLQEKTILIPDPKNRQEHLLPLPNYLISLLKRHKESVQSMYVFPNAKGTAPITEPRKIMNHLSQETGVTFMISDLRRTFISIAESLDIPAYALKRLLNHKIIESDVTAGYIVSDVERLKAPMQKIEDFILATVIEND